jgi:hypothetical protein
MSDTVLGVSYNGGGEFDPWAALLLDDGCCNGLRLLYLYFVPPTVIIAADQTNGRSILTYLTNLDKIKKLSTHSMMGVSGANSDLVTFTE